MAASAAVSSSSASHIDYKYYTHTFRSVTGLVIGINSWRINHGHMLSTFRELPLEYRQGAVLAMQTAQFCNAAVAAAVQTALTRPSATSAGAPASTLKDTDLDWALANNFLESPAFRELFKPLSTTKGIDFPINLKECNLKIEEYARAIISGVNVLSEPANHKTFKEKCIVAFGEYQKREPKKPADTFFSWWQILCIAEEATQQHQIELEKMEIDAECKAAKARYEETSARNKKQLAEEKSALLKEYKRQNPNEEIPYDDWLLKNTAEKAAMANPELRIELDQHDAFLQAFDAFEREHPDYKGSISAWAAHRAVEQERAGKIESGPRSAGGEKVLGENKKYHQQQLGVSTGRRVSAYETYKDIVEEPPRPNPT
jgi:hypothetical protein